MGIDISSRLMVGLDYTELAAWLEDQREVLSEDLEEDEYMDVNEVIDEHGLDTMSPYYDSCIEENFIGFSISNNQSVGDAVRALEEAQEEFEKLTGFMPVVRGGCHVW